MTFEKKKLTAITLTLLLGLGGTLFWAMAIMKDELTTMAVSLSLVMGGIAWMEGLVLRVDLMRRITFLAVLLVHIIAGLCLVHVGWQEYFSGSMMMMNFWISMTGLTLIMMGSICGPWLC